MQGFDYYELLGLAKTASPAEIKSAYRALAKSMHPDAGGTAGTFRLLQEAYGTLSDPAKRAAYDRAPGDVIAPPRPRGPVRTRRREFGADPGFEPPPVVLDPDVIPWWDLVARPASRRAPREGHGHAPWLIVVAGVLLLFVPMAWGVWVLLVVVVAGSAAWLARGYVADVRAERVISAEFGHATEFGKVGVDADQIGERRTAELLRRYFTQLPEVRIFHSLALPGSVFADIDHAVLVGKRLVLVQSKSWPPGHYEMDEESLYRNGNRFRGGSSSLPEAIAEYKRLLPGVEVTGALLIYPNRAGVVTADADLLMTPEQFVIEVGDWLAERPAAVDPEVFRTVLGQVVSR
ncbi:Nuclease-related domain-containing protein [Amycolatopsis xylanica]|uniref:Nuclease-related domain-containing protein n=1 Tax=Amycolatopsis xylanica TaxID=589385 RepID=A0A1H3SND2_9PSEU|nr:DnaJ domain-containing protein [Amycolatopsis xylanica]SDZ39210.1 Nuclease-related domain-containing protein [Amycolatopsis xylanica]